MYCKRLFDLIAASIGLLFLSFPIVVISAIVKISSCGPVFYIQNRVGRQGRLFRAIKFRTMYLGADKEGSVTTAIDTRITPVGRGLRRFKLDELPQLWNVLVGDMSLVGPRPDVPGYADALAGDAHRVLELRPGITGPATLYFRYEEELLAKVNDPGRFNDEVIWPAKIRMNLDYLEHRTFWKDIGYILITIAPPLNAWLKLVPASPRNPEEIQFKKEADKREEKRKTR
jgi:lipopolysaccharide/colanic/teichoic acid biosynthesis glycosyltransferase